MTAMVPNDQRHMQKAIKRVFLDAKRVRYVDAWVEVVNGFDFKAEEAASIRNAAESVILPPSRARATPSSILWDFETAVLSNGESGRHAGEAPYWDAHCAAANLLGDIGNLIRILSLTVEGVEWLKEKGWEPWLKQ